MSDINQIDLRLVDTTILLVFLGAMRHRKATLVAQEMGLTQPAVSHALKRLRNLYNDPLFLRRAHGLEPTALALELEPKIREIVRKISETLAGPDAFDPLSASIDLRLGAFDYELTSILPLLVARLHRISPGVRIHAFPLHNQEALEAVKASQVDLAIGYFDFPATADRSFLSEKLYTENYVLAGRREHPLLTEDLTTERMSRARYLQISPYGPIQNLVDHALQLKGYSRSVHTVVPSLFSALSIVESSDLLVTLPRRVADVNTHKFGITYRPLPMSGGEFPIHAVRHTRDASNPLHFWLVEQLHEVTAQLA